MDRSYGTSIVGVRDGAALVAVDMTLAPWIHDLARDGARRRRTTLSQGTAGAIRRQGIVPIPFLIPGRPGSGRAGSRRAGRVGAGRGGRADRVRSSRGPDGELETSCDPVRPSQKNLYTHPGHRPFQVLGTPYEPLLHGAAVLLLLWLILFWM